MSDREPELVLGGRYRAMALLSLPTREEQPGISMVCLDAWDFDTATVASLRLLPDEARELARRLRDAAHTADLGARR